MAKPTREKSLRRALVHDALFPAAHIAKIGDSAETRTERLRWAVKQAGGHKAVTAATGINGRTLSHLLAGQDLKSEQLLAIAKATGFSVEWLLTGRAVEPVKVLPSREEVVAGSRSVPSGEMDNEAIEKHRKRLADAENHAAEQDLTVPPPEHATGGPLFRLTLAIQEAGGVRSVATRAKLPPTTIRNYLAGFDVNRANLPAIARATGVSLAWLATGQGSRFDLNHEVVPPDDLSGDSDDPPSTAFQGKPLDGAPAGTVPIPRYDARASAGIGTPLDPGWMVEKVLFPADFIRNKLRRKADHLALIDCSGDSMEPTLHHGDQLMVDTSVRDLRSGAIYILRVAGALLAKRVQPRLDGTVMIISDNTRYPPELVTPSDDLPLDIVGEVVWRGGVLLPG